MNTILFDLDSTLLPIDQALFEKVYFSELGKKFTELGYDGPELLKAVYTGTKAMLSNDGTQTNENVFWNSFQSNVGAEILQLKPILEKFYEEEFLKSKIATKDNPLAKPLIDSLVKKGFTVVLATNPLFPPSAVKTRLSWLKLSLEDFTWVTTYNNSSYTKPNLGYYKNILKEINKQPSDCLMVGNDIKEDACALDLGMQFYLVTNHMLNTDLPDPSPFKHGTFEECCLFLETLSCE